MSTRWKIAVVISLIFYPTLFALAIWAPTIFNPLRQNIKGGGLLGGALGSVLAQSCSATNGVYVATSCGITQEAAGASDSGTSAFNTLMTNICAASPAGGAILWPPGPYNFTGQVLLPGSSGSTSTQTAGCNIEWAAYGGGPNWYACGGAACVTNGGSSTASGVPLATVINFTYKGNNGGKVEGRGIMNFYAHGIEFSDNTCETASTNCEDVYTGQSVTVSGTCPYLGTMNLAQVTFSSTPGAGLFVGANWEVTGSGSALDTTAAGYTAGGVLLTSVSGNTVQFCTTASAATYTAAFRYSVPIFHFTNTIPALVDDTFYLNSGYGQDAIVLGGIGSTSIGNVNADGSLQAGFFGYVPLIERCHILYGNRLVYGIATANGAQVINNTAAHNTGILFLEANGIIGGGDDGWYVSGNQVEAGFGSSGHQIYMFKVLQGTRFQFIGNDIADTPAGLSSIWYFGRAASYNIVLAPVSAAYGGSPTVCSDDGNGYCAQAVMTIP